MTRKPKPVGMPGDYLVSIFDNADNEINQKVYRFGKWKVKKIITRYLNYVYKKSNKKLIYSARSCMVIDNTKYGPHSPEIAQQQARH